MAKSEMYTTKDGRKRYPVAAPVPEEDFRALQELAGVEETTVAAQVRQAVAEYATRHRRPSSKVR